MRPPLGVAEFPTNRIANIDVMPDVDRRDRRLDGESRRHLLRLSKPSCRALRFCWKPSTPSSRTSESYRRFAHAFKSTLTRRHLRSYDTFPFIHRPSLTNEINDDRAPKELLACILALAARFCAPLRDLHPNAPSAAAEHYAQLAAHLLTLPETSPGQTAPPPPTADTPISLMRCQCHLLLGFYELTAGRDNSGWLKIGTAIRMAQTLRLGFDDEVPVYDGEHPLLRIHRLFNEAKRRRNVTPRHADPDNPLSTRGRAIAAAQQDPVRAESRRRTFWALFLLDRTVSDGNERPCGLKVPRIASLRMPGPDSDFLAGRKSVGARFDPDPPSWAVSELGRSSGPGAHGISAPSPAPPSAAAEEPEADLYGYTVRIAEIWSKVASYIGSGGRNVDRRPPWLEESTFAQLARELTDFEARLPEELKYSQRTLTAHCLVPEDAKHFALLHLVNAMARHVVSFEWNLLRDHFQTAELTMLRSALPKVASRLLALPASARFQSCQRSRRRRTALRCSCGPRRLVAGIVRRGRQVGQRHLGRLLAHRLARDHPHAPVRWIRRCRGGHSSLAPQVLAAVEFDPDRRDALPQSGRRGARRLAQHLYVLA